MFPKQAANSLVTETSQYFVVFCRYVCSAILAKCLIINVLRLIIVILFFIAFLNITYVARHTFAVFALNNGVDVHKVSRLLAHSSVMVTEKVYAKFLPETLQKEVETKLNFDFTPDYNTAAD